MPQKSLEVRLRFETLLSDLSARFMASPVDQVDAEIEEALGQVMEFFQVDRCALLEFRKNGLQQGQHIVCGEGIEPVSGEINLADLFPWSYRTIAAGEDLGITRREYFPEEALMDRQSMRPWASSPL